MAEFQPLDTSKPITNKQLADALNLQHECLHSVGHRVDVLTASVEADQRSGENYRQSMRLDMSLVKEVLGLRGGATDASMSAGVPPAKAKRKLAGWSAPKAVAVLTLVQTMITWVLPAVIKAAPGFLQGMEAFFVALMAH